jgi:hypothetical protein
MKTYKIIATTLKGHKRFFCYWKMGERYHMRLVILQAECIFYTEEELPFIKAILRYNMEKLEVKFFEVIEVKSK